VLVATNSHDVVGAKCLESARRAVIRAPFACWVERAVTSLTLAREQVGAWSGRVRLAAQPRRCAGYESAAPPDDSHWGALAARSIEDLSFGNAERRRGSRRRICKNIDRRLEGRLGNTGVGKEIERVHLALL